MVFSYKRVRETRPNTLFHVFDKSRLSRGERKFVLDDKYGGQTAVVIEMNSWPMSVRWMRFWLGNLVFSSDNRALVLWVEDWMTLNREISDYKDRWRERTQASGRRDGGQSASLYQRGHRKPSRRQKPAVSQPNETRTTLICSPVFVEHRSDNAIDWRKHCRSPVPAGRESQ